MTQARPPNRREADGSGGHLGAGRILRRTLVLTAITEGITLICRFGLGLQATRDTASTIGLLTSGIRIHHAYIGVVVIALALLLRRRLARFDWILSLGIALVLGDLVHHFLVLWPLVGDPEFHLLYPRHP